MLIRYSPATGEIEVRGTQTDFLDIVAQLLHGEGKIQANNQGSPAPYGKFLNSIIIENSPGGRVSFTASQDGDLIVTGENTGLEILARNLRDFAEGGRGDEHLHVEYFPDHFYLAENSAPAVFALI